MRDSLSICESFPCIISYGLFSGLSKATEQQVTTYECACSSFARIAVDNAHVVRLLLEIVAHVLATFHQQLESGTVMVFPLYCEHLILKWFCIICPSTCVVYKIVVVMLLMQVSCHIFNVVAIHFLPEGVRGEAHCQNSWSYVGQVKIKAFLLGSVSLTTYFRAYPGFHIIILQIL